MRHPDSGRLEEVLFTFKADIALVARLLPDHDQGTVRFQLNNFDSLETVTAEFPVRAVGSDLLDQLARWMVGQPNEFLQRATQVKRVEA